MKFQYWLLTACTGVTLVLCLCLTYVAEQYLVHESINQGADPVALAVLRCGAPAKATP